MLKSCFYLASYHMMIVICVCCNFGSRSIPYLAELNISIDDFTYSTGKMISDEAIIIIVNYVYILAHDHNRSVTRSHLNTLNQVSYFQDRWGDYRDTVFHPFQILDMSNWKHTLLDSWLSWLFRHIHLPNDVIIRDSLWSELDSIFAISLTRTFSRWPVLLR